MLIQFNFKNFRSFRDDVTLDMTATKISEHNHHIVQIGGDKLLTAACIFGANASGKSNVYQAFEYMAMYVVNSFPMAESILQKNTMSELHLLPSCLIVNQRKSLRYLKSILSTPPRMGTESHIIMDFA